MSKGKRFFWGAMAGVAVVNVLWRRMTAPAAFDLRAGGTAVITGASSGIGAEFARQLAALGYDLVLVARRATRLQELADDLARRHHVDVQIVAADLSTDTGIDQVIQAVAPLPDVAMLVNNAGFATTGRFDRMEPRRQREMVALHAGATSALTQAVLPGMIARERGAVINVSSVAAFLRMRGGVNYCATKAYLNAFSESLQAEQRKTGVRIQALCPGYTLTEFHDTEEFSDFSREQFPAFMWMKAEDVVADSLAALSQETVVVVPGWHNRLLVALVRTPFLGTLLQYLR